MRQLFKIFCFCGVFFSIIACKTTLDNLVIAPEFTGIEIKKRPLAVLAVVDNSIDTQNKSPRDGLISASESKAAFALSSAIKSKDAKLEVYDGNKLERGLPEKIFSEVVAEYRRTRKISKGTCEKITTPSLPKLWLVIASLNSDIVETATRDFEEEDPKTKTKKNMLELTSTRRIDMEMSIYDSASCNESWYGHHETSMTNSKREEKPKHGGGLKGVLSAAVSKSLDLAPKPPAPPATSDVCKKLYQAFSENLPKEK